MSTYRKKRAKMELSEEVQVIFGYDVSCKKICIVFM